MIARVNHTPFLYALVPLKANTFQKTNKRGETKSCFAVLVSTSHCLPSGGTMIIKSLLATMALQRDKFQRIANKFFYTGNRRLVSGADIDTHCDCLSTPTPCPFLSFLLRLTTFRPPLTLQKLHMARVKEKVSHSEAREQVPLKYPSDRQVA